MCLFAKIYKAGIVQYNREQFSIKFINHDYDYYYDYWPNKKHPVLHTGRTPLKTLSL